MPDDGKKRDAKQLPLADTKQGIGRKSKPSYSSDPNIPTAWDLAKAGFYPTNDEEIARDLLAYSKQRTDEFSSRSEYYGSATKATRSSEFEAIGTPDLTPWYMRREEQQRLGVTAFTVFLAIAAGAACVIWPGLLTKVILLLSMGAAVGLMVWFVLHLRHVRSCVAWGMVMFCAVATILAVLLLRPAQAQASPYRDLSLECVFGVSQQTPRYEFVYSDTANSYAIFRPNPLNEMDPRVAMSSLTCVMRNTSPSPASNIRLEVSSYVAPWLGPIAHNSWAEVLRAPVGWLIIPLVENGGSATIRIWNDLPGKAILLAIKTQCFVNVGGRDAPCLLPDLGGGPPGYSQQMAMLLPFRKATDCIGIMTPVAPKYQKSCARPTIPPYFKAYNGKR